MARRVVRPPPIVRRDLSLHFRRMISPRRPLLYLLLLPHPHCQRSTCHPPLSALKMQNRPLLSSLRQMSLRRHEPLSPHLVDQKLWNAAHQSDSPHIHSTNCRDRRATRDWQRQTAHSVPLVEPIDRHLCPLYRSPSLLAISPYRPLIETGPRLRHQCLVSSLLKRMTTTPNRAPLQAILPGQTRRLPHRKARSAF